MYNQPFLDLCQKIDQWPIFVRQFLDFPLCRCTVVIDIQKWGNGNGGKNYCSFNRKIQPILLEKRTGKKFVKI